MYCSWCVQVLSEVVSGVDKDKAGLWLKGAESDNVKAQLFANTSRYTVLSTIPQ